MKIGIIGSGNIGGALGPLWAKAGHEILYASRHPERLGPLVAATGHGARAGTVDEAAQFGDAILLAVPFHATPELGARLGPALAGKPLLDTGNPSPGRDGDMARRVIESGRGSGVASASFIPQAKLVRAFNSVWSETLKKEAHRKGDRVGIPLASDHASALEVAARLVRDAGFEPVIVGGLEQARRFDVGTPVYNTGMSGAELARALAST
jgi:predicted dinucleotide-binding enzyme